MKEKQGRARSYEDTRPKWISIEPFDPNGNIFGDSRETHEDHGDAYPEPRSLSESVPVHADGGLRVLLCGVNAAGHCGIRQAYIGVIGEELIRAGVLVRFAFGEDPHSSPQTLRSVYSPSMQMLRLLL